MPSQQPAPARSYLVHCRRSARRWPDSWPNWRPLWASRSSRRLRARCALRFARTPSPARIRLAALLGGVSTQACSRPVAVPGRDRRHARDFERWALDSGASRYVLCEHESPDPLGTARVIAHGDLALSLDVLQREIASINRQPHARQRAFAAALLESGAPAKLWSARNLLAKPDSPKVRPSPALLRLCRTALNGYSQQLADPRRGRLRCQLRRVVILSQRGANGIDGLVSGAAGSALGTQLPTLLLLGDVSLLHDLGGLAVARLVRIPVLAVIDNDGGRIFDLLPVHDCMLPMPVSRTSGALLPDVTWARCNACSACATLHPLRRPSFRQRSRKRCTRTRLRCCTCESDPTAHERCARGSLQGCRFRRGVRRLIWLMLHGFTGSRASFARLAVPRFALAPRSADILASLRAQTSGRRWNGSPHSRPTQRSYSATRWAPGSPSACWRATRSDLSARSWCRPILAVHRSSTHRAPEARRSIRALAARTRPGRVRLCMEEAALVADQRALPETVRAGKRRERLTHTAEGLARSLTSVGLGQMPDLRAH